jgi:hypothetical protein
MIAWIHISKKIIRRIIIILRGVRLSPLGSAAPTGLLYQSQTMTVTVEQLVEWRLAVDTEVLGKLCPSATLSTTKPTWPDPGSNPGHGGGKSATNSLIYGAAQKISNSKCNIQSSKDLTHLSAWFPVNFKRVRQ